LCFGLGTTFYPRMMQMFMTPEGIAASTSFSDQVWLHGGLDILSVCLLLVALSTVPATKTTVRLAAAVGLLPVAAMVYTLVATPFWSPLFLVPAVGCLGFAVYGFMLAGRVDR
jgi:peptidoglycan/LPS O-acetylase OafA/YrhL